MNVFADAMSSRPYPRDSAIRGQTHSEFRTKSDPIARRMSGPVIRTSIYAELGEVLADVVDDLFELAIELEGLGLEAVVSAG